MIIAAIQDNLKAQQDSPSMFGKVNIATPNASSLGKYGDIPVTYHTGIPNISIPIHQIAEGDISLPVSLSYHAGGLKVEEPASWIGAGWSLQAGGVITRTVKDKPDERQTGSSHQQFGHFSDYGMISALSQVPGMNLALYDAEPDLFFFNFGSYSGKFYFNDDRTPMLLPEQDLRIEYQYSPGTWNNSPGAWSGGGRCIEGFVITTPNGTKYYFGIPNIPPAAPYCDPIEVISTYTSSNGTAFNQVISSWYLYKVVSLDGASVIELKYERDYFATFSFYNPILPNTVNNSQTTNPQSYQFVKNLHAAVRISRIQSANNRIDFIPGIVRQDISGWNRISLNGNDEVNTTSRSLGSIQVWDLSGNCLKKFNLSQDYFIDNTTPAVSYFSFINYDKYRLRLTGVQEVSCDGSKEIPPFSFEYFSETVPRQLSFARDHWGYNNGVITNTALYPSLTRGGIVSLNSEKGIATADRESYFPAMRAGTLKKITYPTGGSTAFDFEANSFWLSSNITKNVGGLRVKTITHLDPVSNQFSVLNYSYNNPSTGRSSGVLFSKPTYVQYFRNDYFAQTFALNSECWDSSYITSDNPLRPMEATQGNHIGYEEVRVSQTGNGYSVYRYNVTPEYLLDRSSVAVTNLNTPFVCNASIPNYPAAPLNMDFKRGELKYEGHFHENGTAITEKQFISEYQENPITTPGRTIFTMITGGSIVSPPEVITAITVYDLKTAKKTKQTTIETVYQPGNSPRIVQSEVFYESRHHNSPTKYITTYPGGETSTKRIKYSFDLRSTLFDTVGTCTFPSASFLSYYDNVFSSQGFGGVFAGCSGITSMCWKNTNTAYFNATAPNRLAFIACRRARLTDRDPLNQYQVQHDFAKSAADPSLKAIYWMQDLYVNSPIEVSQYSNNIFLGSQFSEYTNDRDDESGLYPRKSLKLDVGAAAPDLNQAFVNAHSLVRDYRYSDAAEADFYKGQIVNLKERDGVNYAYAWGHNFSKPVAKVVNAFNKQKEVAQNGQTNKSLTFYLGPSGSAYQGSPFTFETTQQGNFTLSMPALPPGVQATTTYTIKDFLGNVIYSGYLCASGSGGPSCSGTPSSVTYTGFPVGLATLSFSTNSSFSSYTFGYSLVVNYIGRVISLSGNKEFFFESFEESSGGFETTSANAHTGKKYWDGSYTVNFSPPNSREYVLQYWRLVNGKWVFNQQSYSNGISISGPVDDVRVFPVDAQMTSYTYDPSVGLTSETDVLGRTLSYEYDNLNRLAIIKDQDKNVVKKFCYNYAGQSENCGSTTVYLNDERSQAFTRNNCPAGTIPGTVTYIVPQGTYVSTVSISDANAMAQADINANGQAYANNTATCRQLYTVSFNNGKSKGYTVTFNNQTTGEVFSFVAPAGGTGTLGQITAGTYNVNFSPQGSPILANFSCAGFTRTNQNFGTFSNISVNGSIYVSIY